MTVFRFQVAHFLTPFPYDDGLESLHAAVNGLLPSAIRVRELSPAKPEFHARFSPISKIYHYKIYNNPIMDPFQYRYAFHSTYKLNPTAMREAAGYFVGKHDFTSFANAIRNNHERDPVKQIFRFDVTEMVFSESPYKNTTELFVQLSFLFHNMLVCCLASGFPSATRN